MSLGSIAAVCFLVWWITGVAVAVKHGHAGSPGNMVLYGALWPVMIVAKKMLDRGD